MQKICFNKNWTFANGKAPFTREKSKTVDLPHDYMIEQKRDPNSLTRRDGGYFPGGLGWYKFISNVIDSFIDMCQKTR